MPASVEESLVLWPWDGMDAFCQLEARRGRRICPGMGYQVWVSMPDAHPSCQILLHTHAGTYARHAGTLMQGRDGGLA